jgi:chromosome segregation ATPase
VSQVPNKQYQLAVAVALGYNLDAIIVDTKKTAYACIDVLKEHM